MRILVALLICLLSCDSDVPTENNEKSYDEVYKTVWTYIKEKKFDKATTEIAVLEGIPGGTKEQKAKIYDAKGWVLYLQGNGEKTDSKYANAMKQFKDAIGQYGLEDSHAGIAILGHLLSDYDASVQSGSEMISKTSYVHSNGVDGINYKNAILNAAWSAFLNKNLQDAKRFVKKISNESGIDSMSEQHFLNLLKKL